jgi:hypothetical protein
MQTTLPESLNLQKLADVREHAAATHPATLAIGYAPSGTTYYRDLAAIIGQDHADAIRADRCEMVDYNPLAFVQRKLAHLMTSGHVVVLEQDAPCRGWHVTVYQDLAAYVAHGHAGRVYDRSNDDAGDRLEVENRVPLHEVT